MFYANKLTESLKILLSFYALFRELFTQYFSHKISLRKVLFNTFLTLH